MSYEMLVGLKVINDTLYQEYREAMTPILKKFGGYFSYDFKVSEVLISANDQAINRVFTLTFPNKNVMENFFANDEYQEVKSTYFIPSVGSTTLISSYEKIEQ